MLSEQKPPKQHAKRWHKEVIGTRSSRSRDIEQVEPEQVGKDGDEERKIDEGRHKLPARYNVAYAFKRESEWQGCETGRKALHTVTDPEPTRRRQLLEQDRAADQRDQSRDREA